WAERFRFGSSDIEFAWRVQLQSLRIGVAAGAILHRRVDARLTSLVRRHFSYGRSEPHLYRVFRADGMTRPPVRHALRFWLRLVRSLPDLLGSRERRGRWLRYAAYRSGRVVGSVRWRVAFF